MIFKHRFILENMECNERTFVEVALRITRNSFSVIGFKILNVRREVDKGVDKGLRSQGNGVGGKEAGSKCRPNHGSLKGYKRFT